jgi:pteridine reductase
MQLKGKSAIVTGGAVRLGKALVLSLAERGVRVAVHYNSSADAARELTRQVQAEGGDAIAIQADLSVPSQAGRIVTQATQSFGRIDILVNNAAVFWPGRWHDTTPQDWDTHFAINLKSPFFLSQAFANHIGKARAAHIVNIADWRAVRPGTDHLAYTLTKAGLVALTKILAQALAPNIQVNAIAPGMILPPPGTDAATLERMSLSIPARRVGNPSHVARVLLFLLESDFTTGDVVFVDGGQHL